VDEPSAGQLADVVGDELVGLLADPCEVADAELAAVSQGNGGVQARFVPQSLCPVGDPFEQLPRQPAVPQALGLLEVDG
jgi:hypothetical protein